MGTGTGSPTVPRPQPTSTTSPARAPRSTVARAIDDSPQTWFAPEPTIPPPTNIERPSDIGAAIAATAAAYGPWSPPTRRYR